MTDDPTKGPLSKEEMRRLTAAQNAAPDRPLAHWDVALVDIPERGLDAKRDADASERAGLAQKLGLVTLDALHAQYRVHSLAGGGWRLSGTVAANVVQSCVITLEPLPSAIDDEFAVEFWRDLDEPEGGEDKTVLEGADVEPLEGDTIPVGRIVFETLSAALDPYPRKQGAAFDWQDEKAAQSENSNPFSVLARFKDKP